MAIVWGNGMVLWDEVEVWSTPLLLWVGAMGSSKGTSSHTQERCTGTGPSLRTQIIFFVKDSPQGPPTANRQPPTANRQPPTDNL